MKSAIIFFAMALVLGTTSICKAQGVFWRPAAESHAKAPDTSRKARYQAQMQKEAAAKHLQDSISAANNGKSANGNAKSSPNVPDPGDIGTAKKAFAKYLGGPIPATGTAAKGAAPPKGTGAKISVAPAAHH